MLRLSDVVFTQRSLGTCICDYIQARKPLLFASAATRLSINMRISYATSVYIQPYGCDKCDKKFADSIGLVHHLRRRRQSPNSVYENKKPYECQERGKRFPTNQGHARHVTTHSGDKSYCCVDCGNAYSSESYVLKHMRRHAGKLKIHMRIRLGTKPYHCDDCGRGFTQLGNLQLHRSVHTGERPYNVISATNRSRYLIG